MSSRAVVLAAGEGKRLRPLTERTPKCLVEVNGRAILDNALDALEARGVRLTTIVVGHLAEVVASHVAARGGAMAITLVRNDDFASTNSMYSLLLGLRDESAIGSPTWVLEGDVFFAPALLDVPAPSAITWFADGGGTGMDGAHLVVDDRARATSLRIIRDAHVSRAGLFKSAGILHLDGDGAARVSAWLERASAEGRRDVYYDLVLADHFAESDVAVADVAGIPWFEIDTADDLKIAEGLFRGGRP